MKFKKLLVIGILAISLVLGGCGGTFSPLQKEPRTLWTPTREFQIPHLGDTHTWKDKTYKNVAEAKIDGTYMPTLVIFFDTDGDCTPEMVAAYVKNPDTGYWYFARGSSRPTMVYNYLKRAEKQKKVKIFNVLSCFAMNPEYVDPHRFDRNDAI